MTTPLPPEPPRRPEAKSADEPRGERRDTAPQDDDDQPDFAAEFDHPSGRLDEASRWEP